MTPYEMAVAAIGAKAYTEAVAWGLLAVADQIGVHADTLKPSPTPRCRFWWVDDNCDLPAGHGGQHEATLITGQRMAWTSSDTVRIADVPLL